MSYIDILALGLAKEGFHQFGQFLGAAQRTECQPLHFVLGLHELPRDLPFDMRPDLLLSYYEAALLSRNGIISAPVFNFSR